MAFTQSGFPVIPAYGDPLIEPLTVAGVGVLPGVRRGDVHDILGWVAQQFHETVARLKTGQCWGYGPRTIVGGTGWSNHAGGAAIDLNSADFPQGRRNMTPAQVAACRQIVKAAGGVVRWGGDYTAPTLVDQMHFEINNNQANTAKLAKLAGKIRAGKLGVAPAPSKPAPAAPEPYIGGIVVADLPVERAQIILNRTGAFTPKLVVDNVFGVATTKATQAFQVVHKLAADGWIGQKTWDVLKRWSQDHGWTAEGGPGSAKPKPKPVARPYPLVSGQVFGVWDEPGWAKRTRSGDPRFDGDAIRAEVRQIQAKVGVATDGIYGSATRAAVVKYQRANKLVADGMVGPATWRALFG